MVLCDVAGLGVIGCACLAGGIPCPFNAAGALAVLDSLNDVAVAAFQSSAAPSAESLLVLCDVAGLEVIGCACLAGGISHRFCAAGALAEVDSLNDVAVAAFPGMVW